jgi:hypothetical protein
MLKTDTNNVDWDELASQCALFQIPRFGRSYVPLCVCARLMTWSAGLFVNNRPSGSTHHTLDFTLRLQAQVSLHGSWRSLPDDFM